MVAAALLLPLALVADMSCGDEFSPFTRVPVRSGLASGGGCFPDDNGARILSGVLSSFCAVCSSMGSDNFPSSCKVRKSANEASSAADRVVAMKTKPKGEERRYSVAFSNESFF